MCKVKLAGIIHHGIVYIANKGHNVMKFFQDLLGIFFSTNFDFVFFTKKLFSLPQYENNRATIYSKYSEE